MRADQLLVAQGLAPTRSAAQRLIDNGAAEWASVKGWVAIRKAGEDIPETAQFRITDDAELRYVSRGGLKLEGALKASGLALTGLTVLDIGQSTGGFTDCLLKSGAARVVGIDVGHGQLHAGLAGDPRVQAVEGMHVRQYQPEQRFSLIVGDLSFISMLGELPRLAPWLAPGGQVLLLIKPQFELGSKALGRGGLVRDAAQYPLLEIRARDAAAALGWQVHGYFESAITGGDGNKEFFLWAQQP
ncbi:TlyA family RNA methyltransferase [Paucibacter sp. PLA-PC-4]|uniref:TlyA family RNA methyltransferase n=1 Tax=Paucibacter sp. PLA-PC-4 TaxID=2993655 RepID=UPI0022492E30|nr:TlyA family RNA methyltransferase [Paucibacter sp. PLA-PC-4]MCX2860764.1 TlyA family RNA methyltransferase [Paucibacter sp. PLA-PC-4]